MSYLGIDLNSLGLTLSIWKQPATLASTLVSTTQSSPLLVGYKNKSAVWGAEALKLFANKPRAVSSSLLSGNAEDPIAELELLNDTRAQLIGQILDQALKAVSVKSFEGAVIAVDGSIDSSTLTVIRGYFEAKGIVNLRFASRASLLTAAHALDNTTSFDRALVLHIGFDGFSADFISIEDGEAKLSDSIKSTTPDIWINQLTSILKSAQNLIKDEQKVDIKRANPDALGQLLSYLLDTVSGRSGESTFEENGSGVTLDYDAALQLFGKSEISTLVDQLVSEIKANTAYDTNSPVFATEGMTALFKHTIKDMRLQLDPMIELSNYAAILAGNTDQILDANHRGVIDTIPIDALRPPVTESEIAPEPEQPKPVIEEPIGKPAKSFGRSNYISIDSDFFSETKPEKILFQGHCFSLSSGAFQVSAGTGQSPELGIVLDKAFIDFDGPLISIESQANQVVVTPLTPKFRFLHNAKRFKESRAAWVGDIIEIENTSVALMLVSDIH